MEPVQDPEPDAGERERENPALSLPVRRPIGTTMAVLAIVVFGIVSLRKLPITLLPDISYPTLTVRTEFPGATPDDVEERVTRKLQEELSTVPNLVRIWSISRAEVSDILLEFDWGSKMTFAVQDVREKLNAVFLPQEAEAPLILRYDPNLDPIIRIGISGQLSLRELRDYAEKTLKERLQSIDGVAAARLRGGDEKEYRISFRAESLRQRGLSAEQITALIQNANLNRPGGLLREGDTEYLVRTVNEFRDAQDIRQLYLNLPGGQRIHLEDIADIEVTDREREVITRIDGKAAVELAIYREADANIVEVASRVRERIFGAPEQLAWVAAHPEARRGLRALGSNSGEDSSEVRKLRREQRLMTDYLDFGKPAGVQLTLLSDQSQFIDGSIRDVGSAALIGGLLAVAVLYLFLRRFGATIIIALAIPISVLATFAPMYLADVTLNIMSLGGLALGIGMLVDNSIVVLESIARCREEGDPILRAAVRGTREVNGAVIASTLTTIAVFFPIVFVEGIAGQIFGDQSIAVVSSLLVSLAVALFFIPVLASLRPPAAPRSNRFRPRLDDLFKATRRRPTTGSSSDAAPRKLRWLLLRLVPDITLLGGRLLLSIGAGLVALLAGAGAGLWWLFRILTWPLVSTFEKGLDALHHGYILLLRAVLHLRLAIVLLAAALLFLAARRVPDLGTQLLPEVHQGEFSVDFALEVGTRLSRSDDLLRDLERRIRALAGVAFTVTTVGTEREELRRTEEGPHVASITVRVQPGEDLAEREQRLEKQVVAEVTRTLEVRTSPQIRRPTLLSLATPLEIEIRGQDHDTLRRIADEVVAVLRKVGGVRDIRSSLRRGKPELRVSFLREELAARGIDIATAAEAIRTSYQGTVASWFNEGDRRVPIRLLAPEAERWGMKNLEELEIQGQPLGQLAEISQVFGPAEIRRIGNRRAAVVSAIPETFDLGGLSARIEDHILGLQLPTGYEITIGGQKREMETALGSMRFALALAIFLVYVVMASQFESILQPFIILGAVPLAGVGVIFVLDALSIPLSVIVFIGAIMLAGIVVNNAIVLIDRINQRRDAGMEIEAAILDAARTRLRPILMTTLTTVLGLLPLILGGEGDELRAPMAITVIAGLLSSTLLTLLVIPVLYSLSAHIDRRGLRREEAS